MFSCMVSHYYFIRYNIAEKLEMSSSFSQQILKGILSLGGQQKLSPKYLKSIKELETVLQKQIEDRTYTDQTTITKFLSETKYFEDVAEMSSLEVCKSMVKGAKVQRIMAGRSISEIRKPINAMYLILSGRLGITQQQSIPAVEVMKEGQKMDFLIEKAYKFMKHYRYSMHSREHSKKIHSNAWIKVQLSEQDFVGTVESGNMFGSDQLLSGDQHKSSTVTLTDTVLLQVKVSNFMQALYNYKNKLITAKIDVFCRASPVFGKIVSDRLKLLMEKSTTSKLFRGQHVYKEGEKPTFFYILKKGQIKLTKTIKLFKEDPNKLYKLRSKMRGQSNEKIAQLPYANLENVYNYEPGTKKVELGVISDITIFGEEEIFERTSREVSAQVVSGSVELYCVSLKVLQGILGDKRPSLQEFKIILYESVTNRRILYRQQKLSELVSVHNRQNMNYFYLPLDQNTGIKEQSKVSQRKTLMNPRQALRRFNRKLESVQLGKDEKIDFSFDKQFQSNQMEKQKQFQGFSSKQIEFKPTINKFNFTTMKNGGRFSSRGDQIVCDLSKEESSIADLTHTVSLISKKVKQVSERGQRMGVRRYSIDIKNPLFEMDYFKKIRKEAARIENNQRRKHYTSASRISVTPNKILTNRPQSASTRAQSAITRPRSAITRPRSANTLKNSR